MENENQDNEQKQEGKEKEKGLIFVRIAMLSVVVSAALSFAGYLMMIL